MKIQVAVAEDNPNLIRSVLEKLQLFDQVEVMWVASNGVEVIQKVTNQQPDVILMDINMPEMNGVEATRKVKDQFPKVKVIMLTVFDETDKIFNSILAGASGYLLKDEKPGKLIQAIEEAMEGGAPMSPVIAAKSLQLIRSGKQEPVESVDFGLTNREMEILEEISKGKNYQQIADKLFISPKTVRKHIENIYRKLQVHNKVEAIQLAMKHGII
ncbi:response regulator [Sanyastnella coralliicola]|uniref:response regulator n=1 Tax=Sanyastnella coralliicola TaxID=3069118 RepID=UPI0027B91899|nr:response regulator transcription factor [Longitalea sp. SCSIO 12813]